MDCTCETKKPNTGTGCTLIAGVSNKAILAPLFADDGTRNELDLSVSITQSVLEALTNHSDASKRWYPLPGFIENVDDVRGDNKTFSFDSERLEYVGKGKRNVSFLMENGVSSAFFLGQLDDWRCGQFGLYFIDESGTLWGEEINAGFIAPMAVYAPSWSAKQVFAKAPATPQHIMVNFQFDSSVQDERLIGVIDASTTYAFANLTGLKDVDIEYISDTTTQVVFKLTTKFGKDALSANKGAVKGLTIANFFGGEWGAGTVNKLYNQTDAAEITISSVTESTTTPGQYTVVFTPAQTATDVMKIRPNRTGFDFTNVYASQFIV